MFSRAKNERAEERERLILEILILEILILEILILEILILEILILEIKERLELGDLDPAEFDDDGLAALVRKVGPPTPRGQARGRSRQITASAPAPS